LRHQTGEKGRVDQLVFFDMQVAQTEGNGDGVVRVQRGPDLVTGHRRFKGQLGGGGVAHLPDHDAVRIGTQGRGNRAGKGFGALFRGRGVDHRHLHRAGDRIFGRILDGEDGDVVFVFFQNGKNVSL